MEKSMFITRFVPAVFALVLMALPAFAAPQTITGSVMFRERMALPAGTVLHVGLVALPSGRPVVGAGTSIATRATPPLAFTFTIRSELDPDGAYGLIAEIRADGMTLFRNSVPAAIDLAAPAPVAILVQRQPTEPPMPSPPSLDPLLLDSAWQVTSIGGNPVHPERPPTLFLAADLRANGTSGCNNYFTQAAFAAEKLSFGPAAATRMACAPDLMAQESGFFAALDAVAGYELDAHGLRLLDAAGVPLLGLVRTDGK